MTSPWGGYLLGAIKSGTCVIIMQPAHIELATADAECREVFWEEMGSDMSREGWKDWDGEWRRKAGHSAAALASRDLPRLSRLLQLGLHPGMKLIFRDGRVRKRKEGFERCLYVCLCRKPAGEGREKQGFTGSLMTYFSSIKGHPRELKIQYTAGLLVKSILYLIASAAAVLFCNEGF